MSGLKMWMIAAAAVVCSSAMAQQQLMIVWAKTAEVYAQGRAKGVLKKGDIISAEPKDREWLKFTRGDNEYAARRRDFKSRMEVARDYKLAAVEAENKLKSVENSLTAAIADLKALEVARLTAARNGLSSFTVPGIHVTEFKIVDPRSAVTYREPRVVVQPDVIIRHSWNDARRLIRELDEEKEELTARIKTLRSNKIALTQAVAEAEARGQYLDNRFVRFEISSETYLRELFRVGSGALLYRDKRKVGALPPNVLVYATPNSKYSDWLVVEWKGEGYDVKRSQLRSESELLERFQRDRLTLDAQANAMERSIAVLRFREAELTTLRREVQVAEELNGRLVSLKERNLTCRLCDKRNDTCTHAAVEQVDPRNARRVLKDWDEELKSIRAEIASRRRAVGELQKKRVELDLKGQELDRQLKAIR